MFKVLHITRIDPKWTHEFYLSRCMPLLTPGVEAALLLRSERQRSSHHRSFLCHVFYSVVNCGVSLVVPIFLWGYSIVVIQLPLKHTYACTTVSMAVSVFPWGYSIVVVQLPLEHTYACTTVSSAHLYTSVSILGEHGKKSHGERMRGMMRTKQR